MAYKYKRRKIKKTKRTSMYKKKKSTLHKVVVSFVYVFCFLALVFLGFSIGKPVIEFFSGERIDDESSVVSESSDSDVLIEDNSSVTDNSDVLQEPEAEVFKGVYALSLNKNILSNKDALSAVVLSAKEQGYNTVVIDLVVDGGYIYYLTNQHQAIAYEAVVGNLTLDEIAQTIRINQMKSVVRFSVLTDHITSRMEKSVGYTFENDISTWIDDSPEKGGKAWISPFKEDAIEYIKYFASEIDASDFDYVIACDIEFPFMRNTDLNYLGASVKSENRYLALQNVWYEFKNVFVSGDKVILDVSAYKIVTGAEEVFSKSKPEVSDLNLTVNVTEFEDTFTTVDGRERSIKDMSSSHRAITIIEEALKLTDGCTVYVTLIRSEYSQVEFEALLDYLEQREIVNIIIN